MINITKTEHAHYIAELTAKGHYQWSMAPLGNVDLLRTVTATDVPHRIRRRAYRKFYSQRRNGA